MLLKFFNFGKIFQRASKDKKMRGKVNIPLDSSLWPKEWKTVFFKSYDGFKKIKLPEPKLDNKADEMILRRCSTRVWGDDSISLNQISNLLFFSCGIIKKTTNLNLSRRAQASGGARYPIEVYLVNFKKGDLDNAVYHYNVKDHSLDVLKDFDMSSKKNILKLFTYPWAVEAGMGIFFTGVTERTMMKYGERGYRYMYYEAGGIANMMNILLSTQGLGGVLLGGTNDEKIESILNIDGEEETFLLGMAIGVLKK